VGFAVEALRFVFGARPGQVGFDIVGSDLCYRPVPLVFQPLFQDAIVGIYGPQAETFGCLEFVKAIDAFCDKLA
jgi:hypothetical protein